MQKLQLSIPEPCHENWQQMTPTEQGRFCKACAKEVIDFSTMTDMQVLNYFTNLSHEKVCGRALPEQLDRTISRPEPPKKKLFWYWNYIVMFFMFFKGNNAAAQSSAKPETEVNPQKNPDVRGEMVNVESIRGNISRTISGKVTDANGSPVAFAVIKIKGANRGVVADANGAYSLRLNFSDVLSISAAGFKVADVIIGQQSVIITVLEKDHNYKEILVATAGLVVRRVPRQSATNGSISIVKPIVVFEVKEDNTGLLIENASITLVRKSDLKSDTAINETKGIYKCSEIKASESYFVKVESPDYVPNEFSIGVNDLKGGKKTWEVLLRKKKTEVRGALISSKTAATIGIQLPVRLQRELNAINNASKGPIYVIDGTIMAQKTDINPADIDNIEVLQGPAAFALFGSEGANGAIVITTRKAKEIKLKEVVVNAEVGLKGRMAGGISYTTTYEESLVVDTIATLKTLLTDSIKVYPNPVQRNTELSVQLKLKQPGNNYRMLVTDATGKILLQRKFNASAKDHTEKITGNSGWAAGTYYIRIFDTQNKLISKTGFIFH